MPFITIEPGSRKVELPKNSPLTDLEFECFGDNVIPFGCRAGSCGACAIEVLENPTHLGQANDNEVKFLADLGYPGARFRLACQCHLAGDAVIRCVGGE
jgi:ferredoxin